MAAAGGRTPWSRPWLRLAAVAAALLARPAAAQGSLQLDGACAAQAHLNGRVFVPEGHTSITNAPYFVAAGDSPVYMYYDPNCNGGSDPVGRWVIDTEAPLLDTYGDLDGDGDCKYLARLDSQDTSGPPHNSLWKMDCGESHQDLPITFLVVTSTVTSTTVTVTTTTKTSTSTTETSTVTTTSTETITATTTTTTTVTETETTVTETSTATATETTVTDTATTTVTDTATTVAEGSGVGETTVTATTTAGGLVLQGACEVMDWLNGLFFERMGVTAEGLPWYMSTWGNDHQYLFHDPDCSGTGRAPRWVLGPNEPNPEKLKDLDDDEKCNYHASSLSEDGEEPPANGTWKMYCADDWANVTLSLLEPGPEDTHSSSPAAVKVVGACEQKAWLNNSQFVLMGHTASQAPYYYSEALAQYLYYDVHCDGSEESVPRWIIDNTAPNLTAPWDLDGDAACNYHARVDASGDHVSVQRPPIQATWKMYCGEAWEDAELQILAIDVETVEGGELGVISSGWRGEVRWLLQALLPLAVLQAA